ncbi:YSIRK-type signal peptide-containing protein, partial [Mammaliicoccus vitulinus]|uniref:YSIRK-type signal peptide-containing protein n=1 Tax=Mammaliicoccus vitulinus TaxID=71237 RepID=UPI003315CD89
MRKKMRYSIRKFAVGVGSVLIGLTLYSGVNTVEASENSRETTFNISNSASNESEDADKEI